MNILLLAFAGGAIAAGWLGSLPDPISLCWGAALSGFVALVASRITWARWMAAAWCGFFFAIVCGSAVLAKRVPPDLVGQDLVVTGTVVSLPQRGDRVVRFRFEKEPLKVWPVTSLLNLSFYPIAGQAPTEFRPGQRWRLTVRLNRPRGSVNPGLFDYEGWLLTSAISATGYVRAQPGPQLLQDDGYGALHHQLRFWLREKINVVLADSNVRGLVLALTIGESGAISTEYWRTLSRTGTNHLLIISGLHVGLVAGLCYQLLLLMLKSKEGAAVLSLLLATAYGAIAGFGLPVQRSLVMTACALAGVVLHRFLPVSRLYCLALFAVVLMNPFAPLGAGFWLSFGAVGVLLYAFGGRVAGPAIAGPRNWLVSQWAVFVGTAPLLALHVSQVSLIAPVANLVAIPLVGFLLVPLLLLALLALCVYVPAGELLLEAGATLLDWVWIILEAFATLDAVFYAPAVPSGISVIAAVGAGVMLAPRGLLPRWLGICLVLPLICIRPPSPGPGEVWVDVLDVGQGLAVALRTDRHRLLYDTGPAFGERFDAGEQIISPWLRRNGAARYLDALLVSHGDLDHAGGAAAIRRNFNVNRVLGLASGSPIASDCGVPMQWMTEGVRFEVLPLLVVPGSDNDGSCVLLVSAGDFHVLLPGDIEQASEEALLAIELPPIDLLLVPHHGSRSSSSPAFINHVRPGLAIYSTGYGNRFGHPDEVVERRYARRGVPTLNTATLGAIAVRYSPGHALSVSSGRQTARRFWYD